jgi:hypothetical protein
MSASQPKSLHEEMVAYIREHPEGIDSRELASRFLKLTAPGHQLARHAVKSILSKDIRCGADERGVWRVTAKAAENSPGLMHIPWASVYLLTGPASQAMHLSVWRLFESPEMIASEWLVDPASLSPDEYARLANARDREFTGFNDAMSRTAAVLENKTIIAFSSRQLQILETCLRRWGEESLDDTLPLSYFFRAAKVRRPRQFTPEQAYSEVFGREPLITNAARFGGVVAECAWELIRRLIDQGISVRADLDALESEFASVAEWKHKTLSLDEIRDLPQSPGVYGFKNRDGQFIYIGKALNVRRRMLQYFRESDESPEKITQLRDEAYAYIVHVCGSELESLLYEYRLIRKYRPRLNTQSTINERKGGFAPLADCIVLLPHAQRGKGMSVWFRRDQKIALRAFDEALLESEDLAEELRNFFFGPKLAAKETDFPEQEIASRWIARRRDNLVIVPAGQMGSGQEIRDAIKTYWPEITEKMGAGT